MNLINNIIDMKKSFISFLLVACSLTMLAQTTQTYNQQRIVTKAVEEEQVVGSNHQVISNLLKDNWSSNILTAFIKSSSQLTKHKSSSGWCFAYSFKSNNISSNPFWLFLISLPRGVVFNAK